MVLLKPAPFSRRTFHISLSPPAVFRIAILLRCCCFSGDYHRLCPWPTSLPPDLRIFLFPPVFLSLFRSSGQVFGQSHNRNAISVKRTTKFIIISHKQPPCGELILLHVRSEEFSTHSPLLNHILRMVKIRVYQNLVRQSFFRSSNVFLPPALTLPSRRISPPQDGSSPFYFLPT